MIEYNYFIANSLIIFYFSNTILTFSFKTVKMKVSFLKGEPLMEPGSVLSRQQYEEKISHTTADLPFALHRLSYPVSADILFYQHWHKEFEFIMVTGGCLELTVESRTHILQEKVLLSMPPSATVEEAPVHSPAPSPHWIFPMSFWTKTLTATFPGNISILYWKDISSSRKLFTHPKILQSCLRQLPGSPNYCLH